MIRKVDKDMIFCSTGKINRASQIIIIINIENVFNPLTSRYFPTVPWVQLEVSIANYMIS